MIRRKQQLHHEEKEQTAKRRREKHQQLDEWKERIQQQELDVKRASLSPLKL